MSERLVLRENITVGRFKLLKKSLFEFHGAKDSRSQWYVECVVCGTKSLKINRTISRSRKTIECNRWCK